MRIRYYTNIQCNPSNTDRSIKMSGKRKGKRNNRNNLIQVTHIDTKPWQDTKAILESFVESTAILTFVSFTSDWQQAVDLRRINSNQVKWGYDLASISLFEAKILNPERLPVAITHRVFKSETMLVKVGGKKKLLPKKTIRMFIWDGKVLQQLSKEDCFSCMNTDAETGEPLPLDPTLEYKGYE